MVSLSGPSQPKKSLAGAGQRGGSQRRSRPGSSRAADLHHRPLPRLHQLDIIGVELAAALKNVIAIAAGICDGWVWRQRQKRLMTRGLVEMTRFGTSLGAEGQTFTGLAGWAT
ncbi:MAG: hypothetical protein CM1200mP2_01090 [Planctomycetaceae bacterium]|nr:MAG: hypothetical protein CM1200mP2_01090 [Planctomycetaceae bacterium]